MRQKAFVAVLVAGFLLPLSLHGEEQPAAVLLLPESDMDRELADDLTEVLISSIFEQSNRRYRIQGKEGFRKKLSDRTAANGNVCLDELDCVRATGQESGLKLLVFGKVGKAADGYRLEIWKLATVKDGPEKTYRKRVAGDVGKLIEEMDVVARWTLKEPTTTLSITVTPADAAVTLDGDPVANPGKPLTLRSGKHTISGTMKGYQEASTTVTCVAEKPCAAALNLVPVKNQIEQPDKDKDKTAGSQRQISTGTIVASSILGGVALIFGGSSIYMYTEMKAAESDANTVITTLCPDNDCTITGTTEKTFYNKLDPVVESGEEKALWANILGGAAAASAVAAATILIVDLANGPVEETPDKTAFTPHLSPDFSGFTFDIRF